MGVGLALHACVLEGRGGEGQGGGKFGLLGRLSVSYSRNDSHLQHWRYVDLPCLFSSPSSHEHVVSSITDEFSGTCSCVLLSPENLTSLEFSMLVHFSISGGYKDKNLNIQQ